MTNVPSKAAIRDHGLAEAIRLTQPLDYAVQVLVPTPCGQNEIVTVWGTDARDALDNALVAYGDAELMETGRGEEALAYYALA